MLFRNTLTRSNWVAFTGVKSNPSYTFNVSVSFLYRIMFSGAGPTSFPAFIICFVKTDEHCQSYIYILTSPIFCKRSKFFKTSIEM